MFWIDHEKTRASFAELHLDSFDGEVAARNDRPFVGVALSGGGSRAAIFSLSVLEELEKAGILDHVTTLSTVSGGSITGAHFALNYPELRGRYWEYARKKLQSNLRDRWILEYFSPWNLVRSFVTDYDRTDALARVYARNLFGDASFGNLGRTGSGRPVLLINATMVNKAPYSSALLSTRGNEGLSSRFNGFTFSTESFAALGSDLRSYPIANAVAASSAFPLVFNPVTLAQFAPNTLETFAQRSQIPKAPLGYLHLVDGGVADNLGVDALVTAAQEHRRLRYTRGKEAKNSCLLIIVDAGIDRKKYQLQRQRDLRGSIVDYAVDDGPIYAFDSLFARRRVDTLKSVGISLARRDGFEYQRATERAEIDIGENGWGGVPGLFMSTGATDNRISSVECATWHISLEEVYSLNKTGNLPQKQVLDYQNKLWAVANSVETDLKLTGLGACTPEFIADRIGDAARLLVTEDARSRKITCDWFGKNGIKLQGICAERKANELQRSEFEIIPANGAAQSPATLVTCAQR